MNEDVSKYYVLSMLSNLNSNLAAKEETELVTNIKRIHVCLQEPEVKSFLGDWEVVWGPFIINGSRKYGLTRRYWTDHAMYLAYNKNVNTYFVGIAGTNGLSEKNWIQEDLNVKEMVPWLPNSGNGASVAAGAMEGFQDLWKATAEGQTVKDFLNDRIGPGGQATIVVSGHSLGGCLTPLMASALAIELESTSVNVEAYPTAGPTPGNQSFANHLQNVLHKYHAIYNTNDVVSQAWDFNGLDELRENYDGWPFIKENIDTKEALVDRWLTWAVERPEENQYIRKPVGDHDNFMVETWSNSGVFEPKEKLKKAINELSDALQSKRFSIRNKLKSIHDFPNNQEYLENTYIKNFARFFIQMGIQHVGVYTSYDSPINVTDEVSNQLSKYFDHGKVDRWTRYWIGLRLLKMLGRLADMVLVWLKSKSIEEGEQVANALVAEEFSDSSLELRMEEIEKIEDESERELVAAQFVKEHGLDSSILTEMWMPFGREEEIEKATVL